MEDLFDFLEHLQTADKNPIKAKTKTLKSFCQTTLYHDLLAQVLWHENQGVTDLPPLQESRPRDSQTRRGKGYRNLDLG